MHLRIAFRSLCNDGRALAFPCHAAGRIPLDSLGERAPNNHFRSRTVIGRDTATPSVQPVLTH